MAARSRARKPANPDAPIALRGSPRSLVGQVPLANSTSERMLLRVGTLHLAGHDPVTVPLAVALRPGTTTVAPLRLDLGRSWPPGEMVGELEVGGTRVPISLLVEPAIALEVSPDEVLGVEGSTTVELTVQNTGNVAIPLAVRTRGQLLAHDEGHLGGTPGTLSSVIARATAPKRASTVTGDPEPASGPQVECHLAEPVLLDPGATGRLTVRVDVPAGLDPTRRHRATIPVGPADLTVIVLPTDPRPTRSDATT